MTSFRLGDVSVSRVIEIRRSFYPTTSMLPDSTADAIARHHHWLKPHFFDESTGDLRSVIQSWIVRTPRHTVLIDTGVGNDKRREHAPLWNLRQGTYLDDLRAAGAGPDDVDLVLCTHLHVDHVGWNTRFVDGRWAPTFPRATYVFAGEEFEFWRKESAAEREEWGCIDDSVLPVVDAGRARLVEPDHVIDAWLRFEPLPGHTPGHACIRLTTSAGDAVFCGDVMHRTVQVAEPHWSSQFCYDPDQARITRRRFVDEHLDSGVLVIAAHFPTPGFIVKGEDGPQFRPAGAAA